MEGKGTILILLVIVAVLTLTLAALAGYLFASGTSQNQVQASSDTQYLILPSDDKLASINLFDDKTFFNLKPEEGTGSIHIIQLSVELRYFKNVGKIKNVEEKIMTYQGKIKELIGTYFQKMPFDEAVKPETKEKAKEDLKKEIEELLNANEKAKQQFIYEIIFDEWFCQ